MKGYASPFLVGLFRALSYLVIFAAILCLVVGVMELQSSGSKHAGEPLLYFVICAFNGMLLLGAAQVIDLIGRIAFHAQRTADSLDLISHQTARQTSELVTLLSSIATDQRRAADVLDQAEIRR